MYMYIDVYVYLFLNEKKNDYFHWKSICTEFSYINVTFSKITTIIDNLYLF